MMQYHTRLAIMVFNMISEIMVTTGFNKYSLCQHTMERSDTG